MEEIKEKEIEKEIKEEENKESTLLKKIEELEKQLSSCNEKIINYENKLAKINDDYAKKIIEKAEQANKLIKEKEIQIINKYNDEIISVKKYAFAKDIVEFLEILNQFNRIVSFPTTDEKVRNFQGSFKMVAQMLNNWLEKINITEIKIEPGTIFDESYMEVVDTVEDNSKENNVITDVISNAYKLHDRIVKLGIVKVVKN